jgi:importin subunit beta-1
MCAIRDTAESIEAEMIKQKEFVMSAIRDTAEFDKANKINQESFVMSAIRDTAEFDTSKKIKQEAFGCLVVIASKYYTMLEPYMETILSLTTESLKGDVKLGALQCITFWITICEKVIELREQNKGHAHAISTIDCSFVEKPLTSLVPFLLETLLKQEGDDDAQSIFMSGATCLGLVARTIGNAIVPLAIQFVEGNIEASDWQRRKAATSALGVILDGPSVEKLAPVVRLLLDRMVDPNVEVRGTAACTLR